MSNLIIYIIFMNVSRAFIIKKIYQLKVLDFVLNNIMAADYLKQTLLTT